MKADNLTVRIEAADAIAVLSERIAALLRAVPPLPVVAWSQSGGDFFTADPAEAGVWKACPVRARGGIVEYVRKADADAAIASLQAENAKLRTVMIAAAETIHAHWDAHCDAEGYGPANLMRRLEEGIPAEYGYTAGAFASLQARLDAAERDAARYGAIRALLVSLVLRTPKGSTITLTAPADRPAYAKGLDAALDGLLTADDIRAAIDAATSQEAK